MSRFPMLQPIRVLSSLHVPAIVFALIAWPAQAETVDFNDLPLAPNSSASGPMPNAQSIVENDGSDGSLGTFASGSPGAVQLVNNYDTTYDSWSGFAYSNVNDTTDGTFTNQYAAITGVGAGPGLDGAADNYAVAYGYLDINPNPYSDQTFEFDPTKPTALTAAQLGAWLPEVTLPTGYQIDSLEVTNTTYAYLSMEEGINGSKMFGSGDFFDLYVYGANAEGQVLPNYYTFDLANGSDIVKTWSTLDLGSTLAGATTLYFELASSDNGVYGMNTPGYFALDNIVVQPVPEPTGLALMCAAGLGLGAVAWRRRRLRAQCA